MAGIWSRPLRRIKSDIRHGRHLEAYTIFVLGLILTPLGLFGIAPEEMLLSAVLLSLTFLVFKTTVSSAESSLESLVTSRETFGSVTDLLKDAAQLWVYAPTAVNLLLHSADIRRHILDRGGQVRAVVQEPSSAASTMARAQLDENIDFDRTLEASISTLRKMRSWGDCNFRLLPFTTGFSLTIVDPSKPTGFLIVELHGFRDENIADRMHILIRRSTSLQWFEYWVGRFHQIWEAAHQPSDSHEAPT